MTSAIGRRAALRAAGLALLAPSLACSRSDADVTTEPRSDADPPAAATPATPKSQTLAPPGSQCLDRLLGRRRMVRRYTDEPIDDATVRRLIDTATRAPSAGHTQPWTFVIVRDRSMRVELARAALAQMFIADAPVVIVACADLSRSRERYGERGDRYGMIDASFASLLLLLQVVEEGLGACFVGAFEDAEVVRLLGLPAHVRPIGIISIGHPAESPRPMARRAVPDVVHSERWQQN